MPVVLATFTFTFMHLADAVIQSDLQLHSGYTFLISMCVPWESNPQPFMIYGVWIRSEAWKQHVIPFIVFKLIGRFK